MNFYLVDDDPDILSFLTRALEDAGHRVEAVPSSLQALKQIPMSRPDCVITDIMMPEMDGFELTRELRRRAGQITATAIGNSRIIAAQLAGMGDGWSYNIDRIGGNET